MVCPFYRKGASPRCVAVAGAPGRPPRPAVEGWCRAEFTRCPAYRYVRAAGRPLHPADFTSWVVRGIPPGALEPPPAEATGGPDIDPH